MLASPPITKHPKRQPRSHATRAAILAAAERAFATQGLAGARTDAIAAEAGVNKALLYYYFRDKQQLYEAVLEDQFRDFSLKALEVLNAPGSPRKILLDYVAMHFDFVASRHQTASLFHQVMSTGGKPLKRLVEKYFLPRNQAFGTLLERGIREGVFRKAEQFHTGVSIIALIVFYFSASPVLQLIGHADVYSPANLRRRKREVLDFVRHAVFLDPSKADE
jgi:TetR/AcrR family transcriptional regulator